MASPLHLPSSLVAKAWALWHYGYDTQEIAEHLSVAEARVYNTLSLLRSHLPSKLSTGAASVEAGRAADPSRLLAGAGRGPHLSIVKG